ncbi:hypothetical protein BRD13_01570 [Halobacteriales archaeon SW_5_70_135]|nr:MAG: hypothetical protein BRD13_01570 [Halobacteriales archaeon SW_5_70_135]
MVHDVERPIDECPACGRGDFSGEYGIGIRLIRYCNEATDEDRNLGHELISGENHPMTGYKMPEEAKEAIGEASRGRELSKETKEQISRTLQGHEVSAETREKISESLQGSDNPWYGVTGEDHPLHGCEWSEEQRQQLSESLSGENAPWYGVTGEDHPWHGVTGEDHPMYGYEWSEEQLERLSEAHRGQLSAGTKQIHVDETGHVVRSGWEAEVDAILHQSGVEYEYEGETFDLGERTYTPDFICRSTVVVEVKGYINDGDEEKARMLMQQNNERVYMVVGSELPAHRHLCWEEREKLPEVVETLASDSG